MTKDFLGCEQYRHSSSGHLFQGRSKSFLVQEGDYLMSLSRYLHLNPVRGVSLGRGNPGERRARLRRFKTPALPPATLGAAVRPAMTASAESRPASTGPSHCGRCER